MDILTIKNLQKRFGEKQVLQGVDMAVPAGSIFAFVGRNGAGKTTTMKAILGLLRIDGGEILVAGEKVEFGQTSTNRHIGYLPDVPEFYGFMTAREYLRLCGESLQMDSEDIARRSEELLELVGLSKEKHRIKGYSRGMKQRLGIAQALLGRPKLLICDEPTSALDPIGRKEILDVLQNLRQQTTVLFSTHILSDVERICTDVALLDGGKIVLQGTVDQLKQRRGAGRFFAELADEESTKRLAAAFEDIGAAQNDLVMFSGDDEQMFRVMRFISENQLPLLRLQRIQPSLEDLFVEVVSK